MSANLNYIKSFDGFRGAFCIVVIMGHWSLALPFLPFGWECLQLFFVLSGYLITRILLNDKMKYQSFGPFMKKFYVRRTLRIFPLYFFYLFLMVALRMVLGGNDLMQQETAELAKNWPFYFTYTSNLSFVFNFFKGIGYADSHFFAHLWSLALEEQFYLFMPFLVFFLSEKNFKRAIIVLLIIPFIMRAIGFPLLMKINPDPYWATLIIYRNLPFQMDALAMGAALTVFNFDWLKRPKMWLLVTVLIIAGIHIISYPSIAANVDMLFEPLGVDKTSADVSPLAYVNFLMLPEILMFNKGYIYLIPLANIVCFLMTLLAIRNDMVWKKFFNSRLMVEMGKVSYGMYVYHTSVIVIFVAIAGKFFGGVNNINILLHIPLFLIMVTIVYQLSKLSFRYVEMPFLKLKDKFS